MMRDTLPQRRPAETFTMRFWNQDFSVTAGNYPDVRAGEVLKTGADTAANPHPHHHLTRRCGVG